MRGGKVAGSPPRGGERGRRSPPDPPPPPAGVGPRALPPGRRQRGQLREGAGGLHGVRSLPASVEPRAWARRMRQSPAPRQAWAGAGGGHWKGCLEMQSVGPGWLPRLNLRGSGRSLRGGCSPRRALPARRSIFGSSREPAPRLGRLLPLVPSLLSAPGRPQDALPGRLAPQEMLAPCPAVAAAPAVLCCAPRPARRIPGALSSTEPPAPSEMQRRRLGSGYGLMLM